MSKIIQIGKEARDKIQSGINTLADAVQVTLGPKGRNVVIKRPFKPPHSTKDGVSVAKEINVKDLIENVGVELIREAASKTGDLAGDGTTTSTILARKMIESCLCQMCSASANPIELRNGMYAALDYYTDKLSKEAIPVADNPKMLANVAAISANNNHEIGKVVAEAYEAVGGTGLVQMGTSYDERTYFETVKGIEFNRGFLSPYFSNDTEQMVAKYEGDVLILLYDGLLVDAQEILPLIEETTKKKLPLLIVADEIKDGALKSLVINRFKHDIQVVAVKAPSYGEKRKDLMMDMAALTGGVYVSEMTGKTLDNVSLSDLGQADSVIVTKTETRILGCRGEKSEIQDRYNRVKATVETIENPEVRRQYEARLATLSEGASIIKVGAITEGQLKDKMDLVEDAIYATRAAYKGGVIAGGGSVLARFSLEDDIDNIDAANNRGEDFKKGFSIVKDALQEPMRRIMLNGGCDEDCILRTMTQDNLENGHGYNALLEGVTDLIDSGIVDPVDVTKTALKNAVSVATTVMTTEVVIVPDEDEMPRDVNPEIAPMMY